MTANQKALFAWVNGINELLAKGNQKQRKQYIKFLRGQIHSHLEKNTDRFHYFLDLRFIQIMKIQKEKNFELHDDLETYFMNEIWKTVKTPIQLLLFLKVLLPQAQKFGFVAMNNQRIVDTCLEVVAMVIGKIDKGSALKDDEGKTMIELHEFLDPYTREALADPGVQNNHHLHEILKLLQTVLEVFYQQAT